MALYEYEKEHIKALRKFLPECMVLLKKNGDFPLAGPGKIAAYGSGVRYTVKGGTGSGEVNSRYFMNVEWGLEQAGFTITTKEWLDQYDRIRENSRKEFVREIKTRAREHHVPAILEGMGAIMPEPNYILPADGEGDTAIYVLSRISGEGKDRQVIGGDFLLTETEKRDILKINQKYDHFMLVLNVGGPVDLTPVRDVDNILLLSQLGVETGFALARVLLGKANPSGKLTTTWSSWKDYCSVGEFGKQNDTRYREGIYVGYRYFDSIGEKALFPFGFGLSYTTFDVKAGIPSLNKDEVSIPVTVCNTGAYAGKEVVQLYVSSPEGKLNKVYQDLAGWKKTGLLAPGEKEELEISFRLPEVASYDEETACYILEKGDYILRVGTSSAHTETAGIVRLDHTAVISQVRNCFGKPDFTDLRLHSRKEPGIPEDTVVLSLAAESIVPVTVSYEDTAEIDPFVENLTEEELAVINIGNFDPDHSLASIIGSSGRKVSGAAGETTGLLEERGLPVLVMADGPAGLRLSKEYFKDEKGIHGIGSSIPETITESITDYLPKPFASAAGLLSVKAKKGAEIFHQYATAIPIGTAIAQGFNYEMAEACGDIVGDEMERFGVHLWLAPALNIHRSILCGRNFEYYSEDPLISGVIAAAVTNGVQKHPGCGTTIKHYAANNQETNRYNNNSQVSERAMREIYLKGFGICVSMSQPKAVMTSYNLLNGQHTSESHDLIEYVLRREFGFEGIVMTDWMVGGGMMNKDSLYPAPHAGRTAAAGGDLFMPGCKADLDAIRKSLEDGTVSREQLMKNASRVYRTAIALCR